MNLINLLVLILSKDCWARYSELGDVEEHDAVPPNVQLMITGSTDPLDPVVLEEFQQDAMRNAKIIVELGKNELRTLSKLTGVVIGADLLLGIPEQENYDTEEHYYGESFTDEGGDKKIQTVNEYVIGKTNKTKTSLHVIDAEHSPQGQNAAPSNLAPLPASPSQLMDPLPPIANSAPDVPANPPAAQYANTNSPMPVPTVNQYNPQQQTSIPVPAGTQPSAPTNPSQQLTASTTVPPQPPLSLPVVQSNPLLPSNPNQDLNNNPYSSFQQQPVLQPVTPNSQYSASPSYGPNTGTPSSFYSPPQQMPLNQASSDTGNYFPVTGTTGSSTYPTTFQQPSLSQAPYASSQPSIPPTYMPSPTVTQSYLNTPTYTPTNTPFPQANSVNYPTPHIPPATTNISPMKPSNGPFNPLAGDPFHTSFASSPTWSPVVNPVQFSNPTHPSQPQYSLPPAAFQTQTQQGLNWN